MHLHNYTWINITGPDATTFLHGQFSADLLGIAEGEGCLTAWCSAKGRVITTLFAFRRDGGWALILAANLATKVIQRLRLFVLRAQVVLQPAAADDILLGVDAAFAETLNADLKRRLMRYPVSSNHQQRFLLPVSHTEYTALASTITPEAAPVSQAQWTRLDLEASLPWVDAGTTEQFLPQELNLEQWQGLSYTKGCYPGQEIVARLRYRGTIKRGLFRLQALKEIHPTLPSGCPLQTASGDNAGTVLYSVEVATDLQVLAVIDFSAAESPTFCHEGKGGISLSDPASN